MIALSCFPTQLLLFPSTSYIMICAFFTTHSFPIVDEYHQSYYSSSSDEYHPYYSSSPALAFSHHHHYHRHTMSHDDHYSWSSINMAFMPLPLLVFFFFVVSTPQSHLYGYHHCNTLQIRPLSLVIIIGLHTWLSFYAATTSLALS